MADGRPPDAVTAVDETTAPRHRDWHAIEAGAAVELLDTDRVAGLSAVEASRRFEAYGPNELAQDRPRSVLAVVAAQFASPLIAILVAALIVTVAIAEYADAAVIAVVLVINAVIGAFQEHKADRSVQALMELAQPRTLVVRDGSEVEIASSQLVPGDIIRLTSGTRLPADVRLLSARALEIDESLLTGESVPISKHSAEVDASALVADRASMGHMGSVVVRGRGDGLVVATGSATELGSIAESIRTQRRPRTPLQDRMDRFAKIVALVVLASTLIAFVLGIALGGAVDEMFLTAVALAVAVVPEGLPVALTVALALGVRRMAQRNAIVRSLPAVETLGSTDVIGSDKTGTLTANEMTVVAIWTPASTLDLSLAGGGAAAAQQGPRDDADVGAALVSAVVSSEATVEDVDGRRSFRGDPTETALLVAAERLGHDVDALRAVEVVAAQPFESERRYSMTAVATGDEVIQHVKGAPERVLELCAGMRSEGAVIDMDRELVAREAERMAAQGLRVLATAQARLERDPQRSYAEPAVENLTLTALIGMHDPPRQGVPEAVARCRQAGIRVVMITGDHAATARAIADELGIGNDSTRVVTGVDVEAMDDQTLTDTVAEVDVYARVAPDHKLRVVQALRGHGHVVAVTGDGVNDGPALKAADIGVAMGRSGTDVAREASDIVLTDDNFVSIASAVEEGRVVFDNVRKVTYFLLSTGAAAIVAILASLAVGLPLPYTPAALLWLNVVTNGVQDVALAFDPAEPDVLGRPPRRRDEGVLNRQLWERVALTGVVMAIGSLWLLSWAIEVGLDPDQQRGAALTTLVIAMAVHVYSARSERRSIVVTHVAGNALLLSATVVAVTVHLAALWWSPTQQVLQIAPVTVEGWLRIGVVSVAVIGVSEAHKLWIRRRPRPSD